MLFDKSFLQDIIYKPVVTEIIEHARWSVRHRCVFEHEGKYYETHYSVGATESQDESPYEYDADVIDCPEVIPVPTSVIVYKRV